MEKIVGIDGRRVFRGGVIAEDHSAGGFAAEDLTGIELNRMRHGSSQKEKPRPYKMNRACD